jgi:hypothetical protein
MFFMVASISDTFRTVVKSKITRAAQLVMVVYRSETVFTISLNAYETGAWSDLIGGA